MKIAILISLGLVLIVTGCGTPSTKRVIADFRDSHRTYTVLDVGNCEGDASAAYYAIHYTKPDSEGVYRAVWQYMNEGKQGWVLRHKDEPAKSCGKTRADCGAPRC